MKRLILLVITSIISVFSVGCLNQNRAVAKTPEITEIRSICKLATLECYYHNVAKSVKTAGEGIAHLGEVDRKFWIEYTGIAKVGIDMSKVEMTVDGSVIEIKIPEAELVGETDIKESGLNYIYSNDGINQNEITVEDETKAINEAQNEMEESIKNNKTLLLNAQSRAQELIENYIVQVGKMTGVDYEIIWIYDDGTKIKSESSTEEDMQEK